MTPFVCPRETMERRTAIAPFDFAFKAHTKRLARIVTRALPPDGFDTKIFAVVLRAMKPCIYLVLPSGLSQNHTLGHSQSCHTAESWFLPCRRRTTSSGDRFVRTRHPQTAVRWDTCVRRQRRPPGAVPRHRKPWQYRSPSPPATPPPPSATSAPALPPAIPSAATQPTAVPAVHGGRCRALSFWRTRRGPPKPRSPVAVP